MVEEQTHVTVCMILKAFFLLPVEKFHEQFHDFSVGIAPSNGLAGRDSISSRLPGTFFLTSIQRLI